MLTHILREAILWEYRACLLNLKLTSKKTLDVLHLGTTTSKQYHRGKTATATSLLNLLTYPLGNLYQALLDNLCKILTTNALYRTLTSVRERNLIICSKLLYRRAIIYLQRLNVAIWNAVGTNIVVDNAHTHRY